MDPAEAFGWLAGALLVARMAPQPLRIRRTGATGGVSALGAACWFGNDLGWLVYSHQAGLLAIAVPSAVLVVLDLALIGLLAPVATRRAIAGGGCWVLAIVGAALVGQGALALALVAGSATGTLPHAFHALRSADLSGIAPMTWMLGLADGALWGVYGWSRQDLPSVSYAILTMLTATVVLWRLSGTEQGTASVGDRALLPTTPVAAG